MPSVEKAEKISVTLPPSMLLSIKNKVQAGRYGSTSEVIREAVRLWQQQQEEHEARLQLIRARLERSANSGTPIPIEDVFDDIQAMHEQYVNGRNHEDL